jgi:1,4-alpha-glucan branching enzyme
MPGDEWQQFANLRLLLGYMWTHPGKKLLFMGGEFGQRREWQHDESLEWQVLEYPLHAGVQRWVRDLNRLYRASAALHELEFTDAGFQWVDCDDADMSVIAFLRKDRTGAPLLVACNFTPVPRERYQLGVPRGGLWHERLNSDARDYGGSGVGNLGAIEATGIGAHGQPHSLFLHLPPLGVVVLTPEQ